MNIHASSNAYASGQAQRLLQMLLGDKTKPAGQDMPGGDADGPGEVGACAPTPTGGPNTAQMASPTLASLLSTQEQPPTAADLAAKILGKVDTDGDGKLSLDEIKAALGGDSASTTSVSDKAFAKLDTDGDGKLSSDELATAIQGRHGHHHGHAGRAEGPSSLDMAKSAVSSADTDGDGVLSPDEIAASMAGGSDPASSDLTASISKLDTSGDGNISPAELASAIDAFRAAHKAMTTTTTASADTATVSATA